MEGIRRESAAVRDARTISPAAADGGATDGGAAAVAGTTLVVAGVPLVADLSGALWWPARRTLVVADLHLEKGSACAVRGALLPPFDTAETLERLAWVIGFYDPTRVIALGDSFHDGEGADRLATENRAHLGALQSGRDWVWIAGNHDPEPARAVGGRFVDTLVDGPLLFRHEPSAASPATGSLAAAVGEIAGHLHPCARIVQRGRSLTRRCFATDGRRLVMPAFGAYTGGLSVRHRAFARVFGGDAFTTHLIGDSRLYTVPAVRCIA
ncbi:ligase-associated DNA damage response endonuclease PdeM [Rhodoplanes serenus]|uniref:Ligase-associated DNA damage response endonuclease PdeM n=1 Tax=Rhodoplanes serenus TaxID=200615 RepID=A0A9X4XPR5_9BRAD|nr:ligase-associated DNA damage response endonuclease PdeM [Rhodoplanes serenus]MTW19063.1 ligase-associated DNA damage response endonuclease PdeM [Rhodoplanes serenus]